MKFLKFGIYLPFYCRILAYSRCAYPQCADLGPFESFPQHRNHVEKLHDGVFLARCKHCPETFPNNVLRKQHIKKFHPVDSNTEGKASSFYIY